MPPPAAPRLNCCVSLSTIMLTLLHAMLGASAAAPIDMGPTFGKDYAGMDYNVTEWHSPPQRAPTTTKKLQRSARHSATPTRCAARGRTALRGLGRWNSKVEFFWASVAA